jgi:hypothetical protein
VTKSARSPGRTKSARGPARTNVHGSDTRVLACIAYTVYFVFGGTFFGIVLILISLQLHGAANLVVFIFGTFFITAMFRRRGNLFMLMAQGLAILAYIGAQVAIRALATMATNGVYGPDKSGLTSFYLGNYLVFGVLWLIFGVPYRAFKYEIDRNGEGNSQNVVVESLAATASLLTGVFVLLLHGGEGPFSQIDIRALIVGDIYTVFLIFPIYRSIAKACWQRGIFGSLSPRPFLRRWRRAAIEIDATTLEYYEKLYDREYRVQSTSRSGNGAGTDSRERPVDRNSGPDRPLPSRSAARQSGQERVIDDAHSAGSGDGQSRGQASSRGKGSQQRRKKDRER